MKLHTKRVIVRLVSTFRFFFYYNHEFILIRSVYKFIISFFIDKKKTLKIE